MLVLPQVNNKGRPYGVETTSDACSATPVSTVLQSACLRLSTNADNVAANQIPLHTCHSFSFDRCNVPLQTKGAKCATRLLARRSQSVVWDMRKVRCDLCSVPASKRERQQCLCSSDPTPYVYGAVFNMWDRQACKLAAHSPVWPRLL